MKRYILLTLFCISFSFVYAQQTTPGRMIFIVDEANLENTSFGKFGALVDDLSWAIEQADAPIVVSSKLFELFVRYKQGATAALVSSGSSLASLGKFFFNVSSDKKGLGQFLELLANDYARYFQEYQTFVPTKNNALLNRYYKLVGAPGKREATAPSTRISLVRSYHLATIPFSSNEWEVYQLSSSPYVVLIPHHYKKRMVKTFKRKVGDVTSSIPIESIAVGLNVHKLRAIPLPPPTSRSYQQTLETLKIPQTGTLAAGCTKLFVTAKSIIDHYQVRFNIYLTGHGDGEKYIAGMKRGALYSFLEFCNTAIDVDLLYYISCYAPLYEFSDLADKRKPITLSYILASGATERAPVFAVGNAYQLRYDKRLRRIRIAAPINFRGFFGDLERHRSYDKVFSHVTNNRSVPGDTYAVSNIPSLLFPRLRWARVQKVSDAIEVLGKVKSLAYQIEGRDLDVAKSTRALLLYVNSIPFALNIKAFSLRTDDFFPGIKTEKRMGIYTPRFISMVKGVVDHYIKSVVVDGPLSDFFSSSFFTTGKRAGEKTFYIRTVDGKGGKLHAWLLNLGKRNVSDEDSAPLREEHVRLSNVKVSTKGFEDIYHAGAYFSLAYTMANGKTLSIAGEVDEIGVIRTDFKSSVQLIDTDKHAADFKRQVAKITQLETHEKIARRLPGILEKKQKEQVERMKDASKHWKLKQRLKKAVMAGGAVLSTYLLWRGIKKLRE